MTDKDFYDRIDKACSLFTSREAVARYCHDIRMLKHTSIKKNIVSKMHSNEVILYFNKQVKVRYSQPRAYAVFCGRFIITVN